MRYGIVQFTSDRGFPPGVVGPAAERAGFGSFWVPEHTHIPVRRDAAHPGTGTAELPGDRYMRTLDPWVALVTLDDLSGGRVTLGGGFAWNTDELEDHNVPPKKRRAKSAHGWTSTPVEPDIETDAARLREFWTEAGRDGDPEVVILAGKPDAGQLAGWEAAGVTEVLFGIPGKYQSEDDVVAYLGRLAGKIGLSPSAD